MKKIGNLLLKNIYCEEMNIRSLEKIAYESLYVSNFGYWVL